MTVSGLATVATFNANVSDEPDVMKKMNMAVDSNGLPLVHVPETGGGNNNSADDMTLDELRKIDKDVRNRRDAQLFLSGGAINSTTTFMKEVADNQFAVDVNVDIDLTREGSPEATMRKMRNILTASSSIASPTKKDIATNMMAMAIMTDARNQMNKEVKNEAFGIPRTFGSRGSDFSMNMGTNNFAENAHTDSVTMGFRTTSRLSGLVVNTFA